MELSSYPTGSTAVERRAEGVNRQDPRRVRRGRFEIDRAMLWSSILHRMHGSMVNEALHYKVNRARRRSLSSGSGTARPIPSNGFPRRKKVDWWCCGWCKTRSPPAVDDPAFIPYPNEPMQPDVPPTKAELFLGLILAAAASILLGISVGIVRILEYSFERSVELILLYQYMGILLISIPPFLFYRSISSRRFRIWGRLIGDEQYVNYKRGAMCSARALCSVVGLVCEYYAMRFMVPGDAAIIILTAPICGAIGAMLCRKRPIDYFLICLSFGPVIAFGFVVVAEPSGAGLVFMPERRSAGLALALAAMTSVALNQFILRFLRYVHWSITQLVLGVTGFLMAAMFMFSNRANFAVPIGIEVSVFGGLAITSLVGESLWQYAHKFQKLPTLGAVRFVFEIPTICLFELYWNRWKPNVLVGMGGAIAAGAVILWAVKECLALEGEGRRKKFPRCFSTKTPSNTSIDDPT